MNCTRFTSLVVSLIFIIGCTPKMPVSAVPRITPSKPLPQTCNPQSSDIRFINLPFKPKGTDIGFIVLDAGHGGDDFGTHSDGKSKLHEKNLNLTTTMMVKALLQERGYRVALTRNDDTFISLDERSQFANQAKPHLFVSIHYNSAPSKEADGVEVFYYRDQENKPRTAKSMQLAQSVLDKVLKNTRAKSRGIKHGNLAVIRKTEMPAILIEGGFMTNAKEMEKLRDADYLKKIALGITQGIQDYLAKQKVMAY